MKITPKKTILLPALLVVTTQLPTQTKLRLQGIEAPPVIHQESVLLAGCTITCASTCARTNQC